VKLTLAEGLRGAIRHVEVAAQFLAAIDVDPESLLEHARRLRGVLEVDENGAGSGGSDPLACLCNRITPPTTPSPARGSGASERSEEAGG
jgi:hypothetical protein